MTIEDIILAYFDSQPTGIHLLWPMPALPLPQARLDTLAQLMAAQNSLEGFRQQLSDRIGSTQLQPEKSLQLLGLVTILMRILDEVREEINHFIQKGDDQS